MMATLFDAKERVYHRKGVYKQLWNPVIDNLPAALQENLDFKSKAERE